MSTKEELEEQLKVARKDIEALAVMAGDTAREQVQNGADHARAQVAQLSEEARVLYDSARNEGAKLRTATEERTAHTGDYLGSDPDLAVYLESGMEALGLDVSDEEDELGRY